MVGLPGRWYGVVNGGQLVGTLVDYLVRSDDIQLVGQVDDLVQTLYLYLEVTLAASAGWCGSILSSNTVVTLAERLAAP